MRIWQLTVANNGVLVEPVNEWSVEEENSFDGRLKARGWIPQRIKRADSSTKPLLDAPIFLYSGIILLSGEAISVLAAYLRDSCELLPVICDEGDFSIVNVTAVLDCIDYERAVFEKSGTSGRVLWFDRYAFLPDKIGNHDIFKISEFPRSRIFVTDQFKKVVEENGITGLGFRLAWESDEAPETPVASPDPAAAATGDSSSENDSELSGGITRPAPAPRDPEAWRRAPGPMAEVLEGRVKAAMAGWDAEGIYAASLYAEAFRDNPCTPAVTLSYNTEAHAAAEAQASSPEEARWNYAFWPQEPELYFGEARPWGEVDDSPEIVERWVRESGFPFYTYEEMFDGPGADDEAADGVAAAFMLELAAVVRDLHASGFVRGKFGRDIPVLVHGLEYSDADAELNLWANGACAEPFAAFCRGE